MSFLLKPFTFTSTIRKIIQKISFCLQISWRYLKLFFKKNKKLKKKTLWFSDKNVFDKSIFTLSYDFENAIYYQLIGFHKSLNGQTIDIYNNQLSHPLKMVIYGFRKKEIYFFNYEITEKIASEKFETRFIENFKIKKLNLNKNLKFRKFRCNQIQIRPKIASPKIENIKLKYRPTQFNAKEFI